MDCTMYEATSSEQYLVEEALRHYNTTLLRELQADKLSEHLWQNDIITFHVRECIKKANEKSTKDGNKVLLEYLQFNITPGVFKKFIKCLRLAADVDKLHRHGEVADVLEKFVGNPPVPSSQSGAVHAGVPSSGIPAVPPQSHPHSQTLPVYSSHDMLYRRNPVPYLTEYGSLHPGVPSSSVTPAPSHPHPQDHTLSANDDYTKQREACLQLQRDQEERLQMLEEVVKDEDMPIIDFVQLAVIQRGERHRMKKEKDIEGYLQASVKGIDKIFHASHTIHYRDVLCFNRHQGDGCDQVDRSADGRGKRVVICGAPGCGKSTLARKLSKEYSAKVLPSDYFLVLLIELRELNLLFQNRQNMDIQLCDLLQTCYSEADPKQASKWCEYTKGKGILLIIDGYDELSPQLQSNPFWSRLFTQTKMYLHQCDIVVTTRPIVYYQLFKLMNPLHRVVEILGFSDDSIKSYIKKFFKEDSTTTSNSTANSSIPSLADELIKRLEILPHVKGLCHIPVVLKIVCEVCSFLGISDLPHSMTGIYKEYVRRQLLQHPSTPRDTVIIDILKVSENIFPKFYELCKVAFLCSIDQKLVLSRDDLEELVDHIDERGTLYSLLFSDPVKDLCSLSASIFFHFIHKTTEEFLAAVHISRLGGPEQNDFWHNHIGLPHMSEVWKFFCGLTNLADVDVSSIVGSSNAHSDKLHLISLFEASSDDVASCELPKIFPENITIRLSSSYETAALSYALEHHPSLHSLIMLLPPDTKADLHIVEECLVHHPSLKELWCGFNCGPKPPIAEDWKVFSTVLKKNHRITDVTLYYPPPEAFLAALSTDIPCTEAIAMPSNVHVKSWDSLDDADLHNLEKACSTGNRRLCNVFFHPGDRPSVSTVLAIVKGTMQRQDQYMLGLSGLQPILKANISDLVKDKCQWIVGDGDVAGDIDDHSVVDGVLILTNTTIQRGDCIELFSRLTNMELECHASLSNCCSIFCVATTAMNAQIDNATLYFDSDFSGISNHECLEVLQKYTPILNMSIITSNRDKVFLKDLNKFCSACVTGCLQSGNSCCITAGPGVLDKDALVEAFEAVTEWDCWIWNGCSIVVSYPRPNDCFPPDESTVAFSSFDFVEFPDGFLTEDCSFRCSCSPFRFSNILFEIFKLGYHVQNVNIDLHLCCFRKNDLDYTPPYDEVNDLRTTIFLHIYSREKDGEDIFSTREVEDLWSNTAHLKTVSINIVGYACTEDLKKPFLARVNSQFCLLVREYVKRRDNNFKFALSTVDGVLDKKALLSEVKNDSSCQWSWKEEDKIIFSVTRSNCSALLDVPLSSPTMDGLVCQNDLIPCSQDQHSLPCPQPPPDLHLLQSTLQSSVETPQCRPTVVHHSCLPAVTDCNPHHSMVHQPSSAQPVPPGSLTSPEGVEAERDETHLSKGNDTRGRIPQKSSSGQADNPPKLQTMN